MARLRYFALALTLPIVLLPAAGAQAAIPIQNTVAKPVDTTEHGAHSAFHMHTDFGGAEHIKDMTTQLPLGIQPNATAPLCSNSAFDSDTCPANTRIGTTKVNLSVGGLVPQDVSGRIYYTDPAPGDAFPGLGIWLDTPPPAPKASQRGKTQISSETGGLETVIKNFPQDSGGVPIRLNSIDIVLLSTFITNPAGCEPATTNFLVTSYEDPATTSRASGTFTPTGCPVIPPTKCKVPNLLHRKLSDAKAAIRIAHCAVGSVTRKDSSRRNRGRVIRQSPSAGKQFAAGKKVNLTVGK
jgi:PASTA domain